MVDDFMVCVDRIIASACLERPQTEGQNVDVGLEQQEKKSESVVSVNDNKMVVECRICQEEGDVQSMEAPCACNGTLKFAHRKCIQRWCNKKGDITCEICNQVFSPNYSLPPARSNPDVMAIDIRAMIIVYTKAMMIGPWPSFKSAEWDMIFLCFSYTKAAWNALYIALVLQAWGPHIDLRDSHLLALAAAERQFLQAEYEDYAVANTGSIACLRSVALILLIVWLTRQVLMAKRDSGMMQEYSTFFNFQVSLLQFAGFLLPCYVMARSWYVMQRRRRRQVGC
ncbi:hypothetical protein JRO89_XS03G0032200 [Xanthoceras sorbifolium]|uniref:RING-CH-type domain-containing protein n=1 Tax=Xanthoceras sorbifolium TaxID=99658 RepID=A0ABQ8I902_9ROSI|nr:hypothetical protein JRO89_XS03G0032200 [Xanthoceras sorbifolium]